MAQQQRESTFDATNLSIIHCTLGLPDDTKMLQDYDEECGGSKFTDVEKKILSSRPLPQTLVL